MVPLKIIYPKPIYSIYLRGAIERRLQGLEFKV